mmetsp:Transcript_145089/g.464982  ORF Transcript_145089/g.464982 Transcript_145089/m.464982 type:complete len:544 (+) Transcript_145089:778-2409(+)
MSPKPTRLFSKLRVSTTSSPSTRGRWEGGRSAFRTTSSKASSQMRCLITASTSKCACFATASPPATSSSRPSSAFSAPPLPFSATAAASSARRPAKEDMGWSRCTSSREFSGRCLAFTSPFIDHFASASCSSSSFATSSSSDCRRRSISYRVLPRRSPSSPSSFSSSSSSPSPSSSSSSSASPRLFFFELDFRSCFCRSRILFSSSRSSSDRSSASPPSNPPSDSSPSSPSSPSSCMPRSSLKAAFDLPLADDVASAPAGSSKKKSENMAPFAAASSPSSPSPPSSKSKSLSSASGSSLIFASAMSANLSNSSYEKNSPSPPALCLAPPASPSGLVPRSARPERFRLPFSAFGSDSPATAADEDATFPIVFARELLGSFGGRLDTADVLGVLVAMLKSTASAGALASLERRCRRWRRNGMFCTSISSQICSRSKPSTTIPPTSSAASLPAGGGQYDCAPSKNNLTKLRTLAAACFASSAEGSKNHSGFADRACTRSAAARKAASWIGAPKVVPLLSTSSMALTRVWHAQVGQGGCGSGPSKPT